MDVYERLDDMNADTAEARAAFILHGLGFTSAMQSKKTKDFSGNYLLNIFLKNIYISIGYRFFHFSVHIMFFFQYLVYKSF